MLCHSARWRETIRVLVKVLNGSLLLFGRPRDGERAKVATVSFSFFLFCIIRKESKETRAGVRLVLKSRKGAEGLASKSPIYIEGSRMVR